MSQDLQHRMTALIRAFGLHRPDQTPCGQPLSPSEAHALSELAGSGPLSQKEMGARLRLEKSTVSRLVASLERRGWVERQPDPADGRAYLVGLTEAGRRLSGRLAAARAERYRGLLAAIPPEQQQAVMGALDVLVQAADASRPES